MRLTVLIYFNILLVNNTFREVLDRQMTWNDYLKEMDYDDCTR